MDILLILGIIAALLQLGSFAPYIRDMLKGTTRPNIVSYALWTLLQVIALAALIAAGATWAALVIASLTLGNLIVIVLCLRGYGYSAYGPIDAVCFCIAIVAIAGWLLTDNQLVALLLSLAATALATVPTIAKEIREPRTEYAPSWFMATAANVLAAVAAGGSAVNLIYPVYLTLESAVIGLLALRKGSARRSTR